MTDPSPTDDTFERSCAHWSEAGRAEMERFYAIASVDYRRLAEARDWRAWLGAHAGAVGERPLRLLDVACGSGKFPDALTRYAGVSGDGLAPIDYALLDPARFSIDEARAALKPPFRPSTEYEATLQALDCAAGAYDVVWATHALYALPPTDMKAGMERFLHATAREGFIAHAFADGHYIRFQKLFLDAFGRTDETPYSSAEDVVAALDALGARYEIDDIVYENGADAGARDVVEGYLQRCIFDDGVSLEEMEARPGLADYLGACNRAGAWRFRQHVALITLRP
ncbi:MAG: class I SAM-dependent methyltransferase [Pseudomonadota bacterium]